MSYISYLRLGRYLSRPRVGGLQNLGNSALLSSRRDLGTRQPPKPAVLRCVSHLVPPGTPRANQGLCCSHLCLTNDFHLGRYGPFTWPSNLPGEVQTKYGSLHLVRAGPLATRLSLSFHSQENRLNLIWLELEPSIPFERRDPEPVSVVWPATGATGVQSSVSTRMPIVTATEPFGTCVHACHSRSTQQQLGHKLQLEIQAN